jgi:hypothetical protein
MRIQTRESTLRCPLSTPLLSLAPPGLSKWATCDSFRPARHEDGGGNSPLEAPTSVVPLRACLSLRVRVLSCLPTLLQPAVRFSSVPVATVLLASPRVCSALLCSANPERQRQPPAAQRSTHATTTTHRHRRTSSLCTSVPSVAVSSSVPSMGCSQSASKPVERPADATATAAGAAPLKQPAATTTHTNGHAANGTNGVATAGASAPAAAGSAAAGSSASSPAPAVPASGQTTDAAEAKAIAQAAPAVSIADVHVSAVEQHRPLVVCGPSGVGKVCPTACRLVQGQRPMSADRTSSNMCAGVC